MNLLTLAKSIDAPTAQAFVTAARNMVDALLIEAERVRHTQTPPPRAYNAAELPRTTPAGGWIEHVELRETARRLAEAMAAEKWTDGVVFALQAVFVLGGML